MHRESDTLPGEPALLAISFAVFTSLRKKSKCAGLPSKVSWLEWRSAMVQVCDRPALHEGAREGSICHSLLRGGHTRPWHE